VLKGIDPLLSGALLAALDEMGHGDLLVVVDANFPAHRIGSTVVSLRGIESPAAVRAIASVFPIDPIEPISLMQQPGGRRDVHHELIESLGEIPHDDAEDVDRFAFYDLAKEASLIIQTGEMRPYANLAVRKGGVTVAAPVTS
jgi:L-fucose mutarotase